MARSISKTVFEVLNGLSFLNYAFENKLINETALARFIKPRVEQLVGRETSLISVTIAVRRFLTSFVPAKKSENFFELLKSSKVSLFTGLAEGHFNSSKLVWQSVCDLQKSGALIFASQNPGEIVVVAEKELLSELAKKTGKDFVSLSEKRGVVTISYDPYFFAESFGGLHFYTGQFAFFGIGIYQIFSTNSQTSFVIDEEKASSAYKNLSVSLEGISKVYGSE
ncbi:hypothetical protein HUU53_04075 [Candidatus Micrarchaeota archaeon]|nr:hypothetical protein [Candidatus Micrarchaeota archaeon]